MRKRNHRIGVYLTKAELDNLNQKVALSGLNRERFLRQLINNCTIKEAPPNELPEFIRQLRLLNENLMQIAERFSFHGANASDLESLIQVIYALESKIHKVYTQ